MSEVLPTIHETGERDLTPEDMLVQVHEAFIGVVNEQLPKMEKTIAELDQRLKNERDRMIVNKLTCERDDLINLRDRLVQQRQQDLEEMEKTLKFQHLEHYRREKNKNEN